MCRHTGRRPMVVSFIDATTISFMSASTTSSARNTSEAGPTYAREYAEIGREAAADLGEAIEYWVGLRPLPAVLVAGGVGFALGWLWTRTGRR